MDPLGDVEGFPSFFDGGSFLLSSIDLSLFPSCTMPVLTRLFSVWHLLVSVVVRVASGSGGRARGPTSTVHETVALAAVNSFEIFALVQSPTFVSFAGRFRLGVSTLARFFFPTELNVASFVAVPCELTIPAVASSLRFTIVVAGIEPLLTFVLVVDWSTAASWREDPAFFGSEGDCCEGSGCHHS